MKPPKSRKNSDQYRTSGFQPDENYLNAACLIKSEALRLGFCDCGISRPEILHDDAMRLRQWLNSGYHAGMKYMENNFEKRVDPSKLFEGCRSVISVLLNYFTDRKQDDPGAPVISKYALGPDYHNIVRQKLDDLLDYVKSIFPSAKGAVYIDTAPLLDRAWAARSGLGWIGRNSNLISQEYGSFTFIGTILTDIETDYDEQVKDRCGTCTRCVDACPTSAITVSRTVDARRCISYMTIENRSVINEEFRGLFGNRVFGCDICQDVCPWNSKMTPHNEKDLEPIPDLLRMKREEWYAMDEEGFKKIFRNSPLKRAKFSGLRRNMDFIGMV